MSLRSESSDLRVGPLDLSIAAPAVSKPMRFGALYARMVGLEFIVVAMAAYASSVAYQYSALNLEPAIDQYVVAAVFLATLVSIVSVAFGHFVAMQRQPLHALLWNGMGAVALAFSFFLSALFLLKFIGDYSRGAFIFQVIAVSLGGLRNPSDVVFSAAVGNSLRPGGSSSCRIDWKLNRIDRDLLNWWEHLPFAAADHCRSPIIDRLSGTELVLI